MYILMVHLAAFGCVLGLGLLINLCRGKQPVATRHCPRPPQSLAWQHSLEHSTVN